MWTRRICPESKRSEITNKVSMRARCRLGNGELALYDDNDDGEEIFPF